MFAGSEAGETVEEPFENLKIVTWNIQALFDGDESGTEYDEYLSTSGWMSEKYLARLNSLSQAISQMPENGPDIVALQEVENSRVLEELAGGALADRGYNWTVFANNPGASLGIGVLSRFPFTLTRAHSVAWNAEPTPRPVLEVQLEPGGRPMVLFICHWKSKLGGDDTTEPLRKASARVILRRLREIKQENPGIPVVIMGDLNENHDEFYRRAGSVISALLPDDPKAAELTGLWKGFDQAGEQSDFLIISRTKPPRAEYFAGTPEVFYSPWKSELKKGSYNYKNEWETIDHFLLTAALFDQQGWDYNSCILIDTEPFVNTKGLPYAYNPRTGNGLSDHLPLMLILTKK